MLTSVHGHQLRKYVIYALLCISFTKKLCQPQTSTRLIHCYKNQQPFTFNTVPAVFTQLKGLECIGCPVVLEINNSIYFVTGTQLNSTRVTPAPVSTASACAIPTYMYLDITATVTTTTRAATARVRRFSCCGRSNFTLILR